MAAKIYQAKSGFATMHDGARVRVYAGDIVEVGHWLLDAIPGEFRALEVKFRAAAPAPKGQPAAKDQPAAAPAAKS